MLWVFFVILEKRLGNGSVPPRFGRWNDEAKKKQTNKRRRRKGRRPAVRFRRFFRTRSMDRLIRSRAESSRPEFSLRSRFASKYSSAARGRGKRWNRPSGRNKKPRNQQQTKHDNRKIIQWPQLQVHIPKVNALEGPLIDRFIHHGRSGPLAGGKKRNDGP